MVEEGSNECQWLVLRTAAGDREVKEHPWWWHMVAQARTRTSIARIAVCKDEVSGPAAACL